MLPFTGLYHTCISSLAISTPPSCPFSWVEIDLLFSSSLVNYGLASSTNVLVYSLLCPTPLLCRTLTYQASLTVHHLYTPSIPDPHPNLVQRHKYPSGDKQSQTTGLQISDPVITKHMKRLCSNSGPASAALHRHFKFICDLFQ